MLYANTDDGSSALWVCDGNGIVVDNISIYGAERAPILEQINEHYGTSFTGWSDNEIGLRFGDPLPNWNAYEKIEIPAQKIAVKIPGGGDTGLMCGTLSNKVFDMLTNGNGCLVASINGIVQNYNGPGIGASDYIIGLLSNYNLEATEVVQTIVAYEVGADIPQWEQYEQYK